MDTIQQYKGCLVAKYAKIICCMPIKTVFYKILIPI